MNKTQIEMESYERADCEQFLQTRPPSGCGGTAPTQQAGSEKHDQSESRFREPTSNLFAYRDKN